LIPLDKLKQKENFTVVLTEKGGHVDWLSGW
jgi:hypothetical protein